MNFIGTGNCKALAIFVLTCCAFNLAVASEGEITIPAPLTPWKDPAYTVRYYIRVDAPGEAGAAGMQPDPVAASVRVPLKMLGADTATAKPEAVLLIGEDGGIHPVHLRPVGSEVEVAFATRSGLRRFYLYAGAADGKPTHVSDRGFQPQELTVKMRGRSAGADFIYSEKQPLTADKFKDLPEGGPQEMRIKVALNDPECPLFSIATDQFGHIVKIDNPPRYAAIYEGFLRAPVGGPYKFAIDTPGVAHLMIDGKEVVGAGAPDPAREPFALNKTVELTEGIHRVIFFYAEAVAEPDRTNMDLQRFGFRVHWQPPYAKSLLCIPPQAFPDALSASIVRCESADGKIQPCIDIDSLAHVHAASHLGENGEKQLILMMAKMTGAPAGARLTVSLSGQPDVVSTEANNWVTAWVPAGAEIKTSIVGADRAAIFSRTATIPSAHVHMKDPQNLMARQERFEMEGELVVKSAPDFVYSDESAHIHLESLLSPAPVIMYKERIESRLVSPPPRPMGEYKLGWKIVNGKSQVPPDAPSGLVDATPIDGTRRKLRVSIPVSALEPLAHDGNAKLVIELTVGDVLVETAEFRLLNVRTLAWPGVLMAGPGSLYFKSNQMAAEVTPPKSLDEDRYDHGTIPAVEELLPLNMERAMVLIEHQNELAYRNMYLLKKVGSGSLGNDLLFLGDPLVDNVPPPRSESAPTGVAPSNVLTGIAKILAADMPQYTWKGVQNPGPFRHLPVFKLLAGLDAFIQNQSGTPIPAQVVVSLGSGDVSRQTPLHTYERALGMLIQRLRAAGAKRIVVLNVLPEPGRDKQCEPYQERVQDTLRQHHVELIDVLQGWKSQGGDWMNHYSLDGKAGKLYGPHPNPQSLDEIAKIIEKRL